MEEEAGEDLPLNKTHLGEEEVNLGKNLEEALEKVHFGEDLEEAQEEVNPGEEQRRMMIWPGSVG